MRLICALKASFSAAQLANWVILISWVILLSYFFPCWSVNNLLTKPIDLDFVSVYNNVKKSVPKYPSSVLKHMYQLCGMASTSHMRITISPRPWQPWTAVSSSLGIISMICAQPQARGVNCNYETVVYDCHCRGDILVAGTRLCACVRYWPSLGVGTCA